MVCQMKLQGGTLQHIFLCVILLFIPKFFLYPCQKAYLKLNSSFASISYFIFPTYPSYIRIFLLVATSINLLQPPF